MLPDDISNNEGRIMFYPPDAGVMYKYRVYALGMTDVIEEAYDVNNQGMAQDNPYYDEHVNSVKSKVGTYVRPVDLVQACYLKFYNNLNGQIFDADGNEILPTASIITNATYDPKTREPIDVLKSDKVFVLPNGTYTYKVKGYSGSFTVTARHYIDQDNGILVRDGGNTEMKYNGAQDPLIITNGSYVEHDHYGRNSGTVVGDNVYYIGLDLARIPVTFTILNENSQVIPTVQKLTLGENGTPITLNEKVGIFAAYDLSDGQIYKPDYADYKPYLNYNTTILKNNSTDPKGNPTGIPANSTVAVEEGMFFGDLNKNNNTSVGEATVEMTSGTFAITATYPGYKLDQRHNHSIVLNETNPIDVVVVYMVKQNAYNFLRYDANGGEGDLPVMCDYPIWDGGVQMIVDAVPGVYAAQKGENVAVINNPGLTKGNATFLGWNTEADGNGTMYQMGGYVNFTADGDENGDVVLYAIWSDDGGSSGPTVEPTETFTVTYDGGEVPGAYVPKAETVEAGNYVISSYRAAAEGYIFRGWDLGAPGSTITVSADTTLTAQWTALPTGFVPTLSDVVAVNDYIINGGEYNPVYDLNQDGEVDIFDLVPMAQYVADN
jgi:hypothetical protein